MDGIDSDKVGGVGRDRQERDSAAMAARDMVVVGTVVSSGNKVLSWWAINQPWIFPAFYRLYKGRSELFFPSSEDYDMSIGNSDSEWPSVIVSNGGISRSVHRCGQPRRPPHAGFGPRSTGWCAPRAWSRISTARWTRTAPPSAACPGPSWPSGASTATIASSRAASVPTTAHWISPACLPRTGSTPWAMAASGRPRPLNFPRALRDVSTH